jgi:hypothetical protein
MSGDRTSTPALSDLSKEVSLLQGQRNAEIKNYDFATVRVIDCHLDCLKGELELTQRSTTQIRNELKLDLKKEALRAKASHRSQRAREEIFTL